MWHGDPATVGQIIALMEASGCPSSAIDGTTASGHDRRDAGQELEGSVMKLAQRAYGLKVYISKDHPDLQFSSKTVRSTIAKPLEVTRSRIWKIARYL